MSRNHIHEPWKPGQSGNPAGRPLSARSRVSEKFIQGLQRWFDEEGDAAIWKVGEKHPILILQLIAKLVPKEMHFKSESMLAGMPDDDLQRLLGKLRGELAARTPTDSSAGSETSDGSSKLN